MLVKAAEQAPGHRGESGKHKWTETILVVNSKATLALKVGNDAHKHQAGCRRERFKLLGRWDVGDVGERLPCLQCASAFDCTRPYTLPQASPDSRRPLFYSSRPAIFSLPCYIMLRRFLQVL